MSPDPDPMHPPDWTSLSPAELSRLHDYVEDLVSADNPSLGSIQLACSNIQLMVKELERVQGQLVERVNEISPYVEGIYRFETLAQLFAETDYQAIQDSLPGLWRSFEAFIWRVLLRED